MSDESSIIPGLSLAPAILNETATKEARERIEGALSKARERRTEARAAYGTSIENTLRAIDETTQALRSAHDGQMNLPMMAFGAGMLRTTPGVASNFMNELSGGMDALVPAIARQRMSDNEFLNRVGELKRMRETVSGEPAKLDMGTAEKEMDRLLQQQGTMEAAAMRAIPANQRMQAQFEKQWDAVKKAAAQAYQTATKDVEKNDGTGLTGEERALLERLFQWEAVEQNNAGLDPKSPNRIDPIKVGLKPDEIERARALRAILVSKEKSPEKDAYNDYARKTQAAGETPLPFEEWKTQNAARQAAQKKKAEAGAEAEIALPQIEASAKTLSRTIDDVMNHPGLDKVVGPTQGDLPEIMYRSAEAKGFMALYKQLTSQAFLESIQKMRGTGPVSNAEGEKIISALGSLAKNIDPQEFKNNLRKIQESISLMQKEIAQKQIEIGRRATGQSGGGSNRAPKGTVIQMPDGSKQVMGDNGWEPVR